ncbi:unnamed protein product [Rhodiola kirilowii]
MKRKRDGEMEIVWQTSANPPEKNDYIFVNGRRHVKPYYFEFISNVKNRWTGKMVVVLFAQEFKGHPYDYYINVVFDIKIACRHEPPVMSWDVSILQKESEVVTVYKPASVPQAADAMNRKRDDEMEIVWQTPANPPEKNDYVFVNGRRHVKPYYFEFISHVKNQWAGKMIVDLFAQEFKGRPYDYYVSAVKSDRIQVDGKTVPMSYVVQSSQKISHFLHMHEPPVMSWDVSILQKESEVVTVYKPASVPK